VTHPFSSPRFPLWSLADDWHAVGICTSCGAESLVAVSKATKTGRGNQRRTSWPRCRMTPDCPGRHVARQVDVDRGNDRAWDLPCPRTTPRTPAVRKQRWSESRVEEADE